MVNVDLLELEVMCTENKYENDNMIRVFDWEEAVRIIIEQGILNASAYLVNDKQNTEGVILCDGEPIGDHTAILESYNDVPTLYDMDEDEEYPCYYLRPVTNWTGQSMLAWVKGVIR